MSLLHLVRDPRGVAYSWAKTQVRRPHGGDDGSVMATHSTAATARRWAAFQSEIALIRPVFDHSTRLRYEDFVNDPHGRLTTRPRRARARRVRRATRATSTATGIELPQSHGVAGNPSRFEHGVVALRADEAWRNEAAGDRRASAGHRDHGARGCMRYGYPLKSDSMPRHRPPADVGASTEWPTVLRDPPDARSSRAGPRGGRVGRRAGLRGRHRRHRRARPGGAADTSSRSSRAPAGRSRCSTTPMPRVSPARATPVSTTPTPSSSRRATTTTSGTPTSFGCR